VEELPQVHQGSQEVVVTSRHHRNTASEELGGEIRLPMMSGAIGHLGAIYASDVITAPHSALKRHGAPRVGNLAIQC
jgi:hypothetical protein